MTHQEKLAIMFSDLGKRGVKKGTMAPWLYRVFWKIGIPLTPPHFASFLANALLMGAWFAGFMVFVWLLLFRHRNLSFSTAFLGAIWSGLLLGIMWVSIIVGRRISLRYRIGEIIRAKGSNQPLQPTSSRFVSSFFMIN